MIDELPVMIIQSTIADNLQTTPLHKEDNLKCDGFFYGNSALSYTLRDFLRLFVYASAIKQSITNSTITIGFIYSDFQNDYNKKETS